MRSVDVVVIGAGPAGAVTAAGLARRGYSVVCIDRARFPRDKACAEFCNPGVRDALRRTGAWELVAPSVLNAPRMDVFVHGEAVLPVGYHDGPVNQPAFTIRRTELDNLLVRMARSVGAEVVEGNRLLGIQVQGHERMLVTTDGQDGISSLIARFVVAADGIHSPAARALGVRHHARWPKRLGLVAHFEDRCPAQTYEMHVGQGVYCGLATQPGGQVSAGLVVGMDEARKPDLGHGSFPTWALDRLPQVRRRLAGARQLGRVRGIGPMSRRVDRVSGPGFGLVGDAAGFLDPFTGEGLYRALHGAELITEAVDSGFRSGHTSTLVQARDYEQARKKAFRSKEHLTFLIQLGLTQPAIFGAISSSIAGHEPARTRLGRVLGDIENARTLVDPRLLLGLAMARGS